MKYLMILMVVLLASSACIMAQDEKDKVIDKKDSACCKANIWHEDDFFVKIDTDSTKKVDRINAELRHPTVEIYGGMGQPSIYKDAFSSKLSKTGLLEIKLGNTKTTEFQCDRNVLLVKQPFLFLGNLSNTLFTSSSNNSNELKNSAWRFGVGELTGLGYKLGENSNLVFFNSGSINWTKVTFKDTVPLTALNKAKDDDVINTFGNAFRFGSISEGGIRAQLFYPVSVSVSYERAIVFPRHMFWYWTASVITEGIGDALLNEFVKHLARFSPKAAPVVYWVLRNGFDYGIYELRKKSMNWPVNTSSPLMYDNYKVGLSFVF